MRTWPYFVPEDDELPYLTDDERAFAAVLSEATVPLICSEVSDLLIPSVIARDFQRDNGLVSALCLDGESLRTSRYAPIHCHDVCALGGMAGCRPGDAGDAGAYPS